MASPPGQSRPIPAEEPSRANDVVSGTSTASYFDPVTEVADQGPCRWRTADFHDQECSRYVDCPTHAHSRGPPADTDTRGSRAPERDARTTRHDRFAAELASDEGAIYGIVPFGQAMDTLPSRISEAHEASDLFSRSELSTHDTLRTEQAMEALPPRDLDVREASGRSSGSEVSIHHTLRGKQETEALPSRSPDDHETSEPSTLAPDSSQAAVTAETIVDQTITLPIRTSSLARGLGDVSPSDPGHVTEHVASIPSAPTQQGDEDERATYEQLTRLASVTSPLERQPRSLSGGSGDPRDLAASQESLHLHASPGFVLPRWQPDSEATLCPICQAQFSIFVRKHHCRKCGRVVCNSCSPHRIIIPHQYIVRPSGSMVPSIVPLPPRLPLGSLDVGYVDGGGPSGGERVRLCNPCVPDPNTAPPLSPALSAGVSPPPTQHGLGNNNGHVYGTLSSAIRYGSAFAGGHGGGGFQYYPPRSRSITMGTAPHGVVASAGPHQRVSATYESPFDRFPSVASSSTPSGSRRHRQSNSVGDGSRSSPRHRALPPLPPPIAEDDECPICHRELPSRSLPDFEQLRESHVTECILAHSAYGSPQRAAGDAARLPVQRRSGMYTYAATEKDCIDDAECTICLEEFAAGVPMARLECLCRFHRACISAWFISHPGRCPVHQHDGFGF
ncbi:hypothetical protein DCS_05301 [Drechmeria coniospora]|uniref:RING-type E3 ubiquitin transferase n=1 Tax=Drechmeria coniospora TaxID=98403 RepID=A0A151GMI9_DRECN|nr:hypothetical protein DCS_05301 [Drechmeria coniospora]KYK58288.1 hypothetical protein DCS_05301 [Drechmeria coniospora]